MISRIRISPVLRRTTGLALLVAAMLSYPLSADSAEVSFKGKTLRIIIDTSSGGGTDANARSMGRYMAKYLPGDPSIVYSNLPGGGGIKANNYFANQVKPDGLTVLVQSALNPAQLRQSSAKFKPADYRFVGGTKRLGTVVLVNQNAISRLKDANADPVIFGDTDGTRSGTVLTAWGRKYLGWNVRFVRGYGGLPEMELAARRGESEMIAVPHSAAAKDLMSDGKLTPFVQFGVRDSNDRLLPRVEFPDVPVLDHELRTVMQAKFPQDLKAYEAWIAFQLVDKCMALPPNTPDDVVETWRTAFAKLGEEPDFLALGRRQFGEQFGIHHGAAMDRIAKQIGATSDADLAVWEALF